MFILRKALKKIARNDLVYKLAKRIVSDRRGENDCNMEINGESLVIRKFLSSENQVLFDVGANTGDWTKNALAVSKKNFIHAFEPCQATFEKLRSNNFPSNVVLNNTALGSIQGEQEFFNYGDGSTINSLYRRDLFSHAEKEIIKINTVDNYCENNSVNKIDFLKIDVEGNELEVLRGCQNMLQKENISVIQFEYGGTFADAKIWLKDIFDFFKEFKKYKFFKILHDRIEPVCYDCDLENYQYCNYLIIKE